MTLLDLELGLTYQNVISSTKRTALIGNRETCNNFIICLIRRTRLHDQLLAAGGQYSHCPPDTCNDPSAFCNISAGFWNLVYLRPTLEISIVKEVVLWSTANGLLPSILGHDRKTCGKHVTAISIMGSGITSNRMFATYGNGIKVR